MRPEIGARAHVIVYVGKLSLNLVSDVVDLGFAQNLQKSWLANAATHMILWLVDNIASKMLRRLNHGGLAR
ncbi:hypothetical protein TIFTF001_011039 [Ficus carica]|uniref:Uncharacterized protein n=1 Tax=Ficus carica TaxID=3494 RepID=A0AA87ZZ62_FICCA|nr:hypothetical protein TIFTF001_011039 [Ficus carica]